MIVFFVVSELALLIEQGENNGMEHSHQVVFLIKNQSEINASRRADCRTKAFGGTHTQ